MISVENLWFVEPNEAAKAVLVEKLGNCNFADNAEQLLSKCQRVVLAVKPQVLLNVGSDWKPAITSKHLIVSIAAGISLVPWPGRSRASTL